MEKAEGELNMNYRNCIDAYNSLGYCIKFRTSLQDLLIDAEVDNDSIAAKPAGAKVGIFTQLV